MDSYGQCPIKMKFRHGDSLTSNNKVPGPGQYNPSSKEEKGVKFAQAKRDGGKDQQVPGAGSYNVRSEIS
jgi:hypothetical protein